jgi:hypothetical protein
MRTPLARGFFLAAAALAVCACKPRDEVTGSPQPPASFGAVAKTAGCPKLAGVFEWPQVEGAPQGYKEGGLLRAPRSAPEFFGLTLARQGTLTVHDPGEDGKKRLRIDSRVTDARFNDARRFSRREFMDDEFRCEHGWVVTSEYPHPRLEARDEYGGPISMGAKLATLADGDLAVGQWMRKHGGKHSLFEWGGIGSRGAWIPYADTVTWYWSRYRRIKP